MWGNDNDAQTKRRLLFNTHYTVCASPAYLNKQKPINKIDDISALNYIQHAGRLDGRQIKFDNGKVVFVEPYYFLNDVSAMVQAALQGDGIIMLHDYEVRAYIESGELQSLFDEKTKEIQPVYVYYQNKKYQQPKVRRFLDFMFEKNNV